MRSLLGGIALTFIFGVTVLFLLVAAGSQPANAAWCMDGSYVAGNECVWQLDGTYTGRLGGYQPGPTFNSSPALQGKTFSLPDIMGKFESLRAQRLQNKLLELQIQRLQQQLQQQ